MSGFEIAGLVLAVVPLILEGFKAPHAKPLKYLRLFPTAKLERRDFAIQLDLLNAELRFTMLNVFKRINVLLTPDQSEVLTADDSMGADFFKVWNDVWEANPDEIKLVFSHTLDRIQRVLDNMVDLLNEMVKHTGIPSKAGTEMLREIIQNHDIDKTSTITNFSGRFMFAKSDSRRRKLVKLMGEDIEILKKLNTGQETVKNFITHAKLTLSQESHAAFLARVHSYCDTLHHALSNIWQCECHKSPSALLRLEKRRAPEPKAIDPLRFSLFLTFKFSADNEDLWRSQETEICVDQTYVPFSI